MNEVKLSFISNYTNGALHHANELNNSLAKAIEKFEFFCEKEEIISPNALKIFRIYKKEVESIMHYLNQISDLTNKEATENDSDEKR